MLRVETTIIRPRDFKSYRRAEGDPKGKRHWRILRRGLADLKRRAEVSHAANERYLAALASTTGSIRLSELAAKVRRPLIRERKRYRALNPWSEKDGALLEAISRGEFAIRHQWTAEP